MGEVMNSVLGAWGGGMKEKEVGSLREETVDVEAIHKGHLQGCHKSQLQGCEVRLRERVLENQDLRSPLN